MSELAQFRATLQRDLRIAVRRPVDLLVALVFFVVVASLFPLGIGPDPDALRTLAPALVWIAALLSAVLSLTRMFSADFSDGTLEQMVLAPGGLTGQVFAKVCGHWLMSGLPLVLIGPVLGLQFDLPPGALRVLALSLLAGTPVLSLIGAVGAALTLGLRSGGALLALLVLPLYMPVLIFGTAAVVARTEGADASGHLSLLGAMLLIALVFAPWAIACALRISVE